MILKKLLNWFHDTLYDHLVILDVIANSTYIYIRVCDMQYHQRTLAAQHPHFFGL